MYSIMNENGKPYNGYTEFIADSQDNINELPTDVAIGSTCLIIDGRKIYILNNKREWVPFSV